MGLSNVLLMLVCAAASGLSPVGAKAATINVNAYLTDSTITNVTSVTAGQTSTIDLLLTDQATNATVGSVLGFCVALRSQGPSQCQYTTHLASGTLQVAGQVSAGHS